LVIVDGDPNNDGDPSDAEIAGRIDLTRSSAGILMDDTVNALPGTGGMGVLPIPVVYNGYVQNLPEEWKSQLTAKQQDPIS
jgi:hypothetical protein